MNKINLTKGLFLLVTLLIAYDLLFDPGPMADLSISAILIIPSYFIFNISQIRAFKIYFYLQILDLNLVLFVNKLTIPSQITSSLYLNLTYAIALLSTVSFLIMLAGINYSKILSLNNYSKFNKIKLISHLFFSTILIQTVIRLS